MDQALVGLRHRNRNVRLFKEKKSLFLTVLACFKAMGEFSVALVKKRLIFIKFSMKKSSPNT